jgi:dienelactone hydrolase
MKKNFGLLIAIIVVSLVAGCSKGVPLATPTSNPVYLGIAEQTVDNLASGNTSAVFANFDTVMQKAVTIDQLNQLWLQLQVQYGNYLNRAGSQTVVEGGYTSVIVNLHFQYGDTGFKVTFDAAGKIAGLHLVAAPNAAPTPTSEAYLAPTYADPNSFKEIDVTIGTGEWALPGTLSIPKGNGPFPAVVLVHGSGPNDRDETIGPNKPFKDIAWGLASRGITVLRYDKRTLVHANLFTPDVLKNLTLQQETIDDALLAVQLLRTRPEVDKNQIYVLGHSLGAMAAPRIGQQDPSIAGLIILAGATRPLEDIIIEQYTYIFGLKGTMTDAEKAYLQTLETATALVKSPSLTVDTPASELPLGASGAYWLDMRNYYNPATTAATLDMRLLILQGGRDYQVTPDNLDGWKTALTGKTNVLIKLYPDLNHLFISGTGKSTPEEYSLPGHVAEEVIQDIAAWIPNK